MTIDKGVVCMAAQTLADEILALNIEVDEFVKILRERSGKPIKWRVTWQQCPHIHSTPRVLFIEAPDEAAAKDAAKHYVERTCGITWFSIFTVEEYTEPVLGKVMS